MFIGVSGSELLRALNMHAKELFIRQIYLLVLLNVYSAILQDVQNGLDLELR